MEITKYQNYPLWLLMKLAYRHNRRGKYELLSDYPAFGSSDNKYNKHEECHLYVPKPFVLGNICQYVLTATIGEDGLIKCEPWTLEKLKKGGYAILDDLDVWHEKGIEFVNKINEFLDRPEAIVRQHNPNEVRAVKG